VTPNIQNAILSFKDRSVLVVGDVLLDHYVYGTVSRISPEAPIPVLNRSSERYAPGGAGNVVSNLVALGAKALLCGVVGDDPGKDTLCQILHSLAVDTEGLVIDASRPTPVKTRYISKKHQLLRLDHEATHNVDAQVQATLLDLIRSRAPKCDVAILSDYAKGLFDEAFARDVIGLIRTFGKPIIVDTKPQNRFFFQSVDVVTPNLQEALAMSGRETVDEAGVALVDFFHADVVVTKGDQGMSVFKRDGTRTDVGTKSIDVTDVSGAGDTVVAVVALSLSTGMSLEDSATIANYAGGIVVQKAGTATVTIEELLSVAEPEGHVDGVPMVPKLWGYEKWLENNDKYCCKILSLNKGFQCSLHYHEQKDEMFLVTMGHVRLEVDGRVMYLRPGHFARIVPGAHHRFRGIEDSIIIEVSTHHEDVDSYRLESACEVTDSMRV
jgi:D-beta-D-heptose 7-phosphate kinase/D-beta-D-heptose 1-phosphate adenosyltransferase